jgi:4'-phosphopantetheinyl transferase
MADILYTCFQSKLEDAVYKRFFAKLPSDIQSRINRYVRWQDRQAGIFGKLLLSAGLEKYGHPSDCLTKLLYNKFGKPFLDKKIDFNISHSGEYAVCAVTGRGAVGIDIEKIRNIDLSDFERYMTPHEWEHIKNSENPYEKFYEYWTLKESVMKAYGQGLSVPLKDICVDKERVSLYETIWFVKEVSLHCDYKCHIAVNVTPFELNIKKIDFYQEAI